MCGNRRYMKIIKKTLVCLLAGLLVALVAGAAACYLKYRHVAAGDLPVVHATTTLSPADGKTRIGSVLGARYEFVAPWSKVPTTIEAKPGEGSQLVNQPSPQIRAIQWGTATWDIDCAIQPFVLGEIPEGKLRVSFVDGSGKTMPFELDIPKLVSEPLPDMARADLTIAGKLPPPATPRWVYVAGGVTALAILGLLLYLMIRRKASEPAPRLPPWIVALADLKSLHKGFDAGEMRPLECVSALTDIVRNYLEERFRIHAPRQTTDEFLRNLDSADSPLKNSDRNFLREFMTSADMVKFARWDAPHEMIAETIDHAADLVTGTIPDKTEPKVAESGQHGSTEHTNA